MIKIEGKYYDGHQEFFQKYPWKREVFRRKNFKVYAEALSKRCMDCKLFWHPAAMTLDHTERDGYRNSKGKRKYPTDMLQYYPPIFLEEVKKCEPVCQNCHTLREMTRDGHDRTGKWKDWRDAAREGALLV